MDNLNDIYKRKFGESDDIKSLGWGSIDSQETRFKMLMDINGFRSSDTLLDVGCGFGDLSKYIGNYTGVDIRGHAIKTAISRYPDKRFIKGELIDVIEAFDWVFASGIFCFKSENWHSETRKTLSDMLIRSKKGVSVNFLSNLSNGNRDDEMMYVSMSDIAKVLDGLTTKFSIRHDYRPNDCTVYLYK